ncbi:MAG TPA: antibiotic biosynthesis monooxygenase family protein [Pseudolabrys sp.]|nr:antibiotic biosynthesis monooxygenase family protein [Pseudolabrys sp.]
MSFIVVARWRAKDGAEEKIAAILAELAAAIRAEPGNLKFVVHRSTADPREILLYEEYRSEQAFKDHRDTKHFKDFVLGRAVPLLARREIEMFSIVE